MSVNPAPEDAVLNKYAFADRRSTQTVPSELSNPVERKLFLDIESYMIYNEKEQFDEKTVGLIRDLLSSGLYPDIFMYPNSSVKKIMRGLNINRDTFSSFAKSLNLSVGDDLSEKGITLDKKFVYTPLQFVSSWSASKGIAVDFARNRISRNVKNSVAVILTADVADNPGILLSLKGMYNLKGLNKHAYEDEILALSTVNVSNIYLEHVYHREIEVKDDDTFAF